MTAFWDQLRKKILALPVLSVSSIASYSYAQVPEIVEPSTITTSMHTELRHDDNIFLSAANAQSSLITVLSPSLMALLKPSRHRIQFRYSGEFASYASSSADNYADHELQAAASLESGRRGLLNFIGTYQIGHESRGTGLSEGLDPGSGIFPSEPDEYTQARALGKFTFGATGTRGRLVIEAGRRELEYSNNRERTRFFDYDNTHGSAAFYFRVMPSTSLLLSVRADDFDYPNERSFQPSLDSREHHVLVGATWDITDKSTGVVRFGYVKKNYDDNVRPDFTATSWEADVRWSVRSYSHFNFRTSRQPSEATSIIGDVILNTKYSVAWSHHWTPRIMTRLDTLYSRQNFRGSAEARLGRLNQHGLTVSYEMRRWITWELGASFSSQDSNVGQFDFDVRVVSLGANVTF